MDNSVMISNHRMIVEVDGDRYLSYFKNANEMLHEASRIKAFDDCEPVTIISIRSYDYDWHFMGWQPQMLYEWHSDNGETWSKYYPEWDH